MKLNDAVFGALLVVLAAAVLVTVQGFARIPGQNVGPGLFPGLVATGLGGCGLILVYRGLRSRGESRWIELMAWTRSRPHVIAFATLVASVVAYIYLANALGFLVVAPLALFAMFLSLRVRPATSAVVAVLAAAVIWYAFYKLLRVPLPWGVLERFAF